MILQAVTSRSFRTLEAFMGTGSDNRLANRIDRFAALPFGGQQTTGSTVCQMKLPQSCCGGKGYVLATEGALVTARVCDSHHVVPASATGRRGW
jgi:hypothetical protein